jgi:hypothetical protein
LLAVAGPIDSWKLTEINAASGRPKISPKTITVGSKTHCQTSML